MLSTSMALGAGLGASCAQHGDAAASAAHEKRDIHHGRPLRLM
jgi:hypothetical protein